MGFPRRTCGGVRLLVVTEEQRYSPRWLGDNDGARCLKASQYSRRLQSHWSDKQSIDARRRQPVNDANTIHRIAHQLRWCRHQRVVALLSGFHGLAWISPVNFFCKKDLLRKWISLYFDFVNPLLAALDGFRLLVSGFILVLALDFDI